MSHGIEFKHVGRKSRITQFIRDLIHRIARENKSWDYRRIKGELKKLGIRIGDSTVRKIMVDDGLEPPPYPRPDGKFILTIPFSVAKFISACYFVS